MAIHLPNNVSSQVSNQCLEEVYQNQGIPPHLLKSLERLPPDCKPILLIRHAQRADIPLEGTDTALLTQEGKKAAQLLGRILGSHRPGALICSPMDRCVETLEKICEGASWNLGVIKDPFFAPSGPFITDLKLATEEYKRVGGPVLFNRQIKEMDPPPGMRSTAQGVSEFLERLLSRATDKGRINVCVTHDAVMTVVIGFLLQCEFNQENWPDFLDGALLWDDGIRLHILWRGESYPLDWAHLFERMPQFTLNRSYP